MNLILLLTNEKTLPRETSAYEKNCSKNALQVQANIKASLYCFAAQEAKLYNNWNKNVVLLIPELKYLLSHIIYNNFWLPYF